MSNVIETSFHGDAGNFSIRDSAYKRHIIEALNHRLNVLENFASSNSKDFQAEWDSLTIPEATYD